MGDHVYFSAYGPFGGELYRTDGTSSGTVLIKDINVGPAESDPEGLTEFNGELFFVADDGTHGHEIWKTDGTEAGTTLVADLDLEYLTVYFQGSFTKTDSALYFMTADMISQEYYLYRCDGTSVSLVSGITPYSDTVMSDGTLAYFTNYVNDEYEVWRTDGSTTGTFRIAGPSPVSDFAPYYGAVADGLFYFAAGDAIYKTDGTLEGTSLVWEQASARPGQLTTVGSTIFFSANTPGNGYELWKTDGTNAGTAMVKDLVPFGSSYPNALTNVNGLLYFFAENPSSLWKSDGSEAGTVMVKVLDGSHFTMTTAGGKVYFESQDDLYGREMQVSDGTEEGTYLLDLYPGPGSSWPISLTSIDDMLYFSVEQGIYDMGVNILNPADDSIAHIRPDEGPAASLGIEYTVQVGNRVYFRGYTAEFGWEPWVTDGTAEGTHMLIDANPGVGSSNPEDFVEIGGKVCFLAATSDYSYDLYSPDGTPAGTEMIQAIGQEYPPRIYTAGGYLFFGEWRGNYAMWRSDGTSAGTWIVRTDLDDDRMISTGDRIMIETRDDGLLGYDPATSNTETIIGDELLDYIYARRNIVLNGSAYFVHDVWPIGSTLYKSDGTAAGTHALMDFVDDAWMEDFISPVNGKLFFITGKFDEMINDLVFELWATDGSENGETKLTDLPLFDQDTNLHIAPVGSSFIFNAGDQTTGEELWITDASGAAGTMLLNDLNPGSGDSVPNLFTVAGDVVYFAANDGVHGRELWQTDGTPAGTVLVADINPGAGSSMPTFSEYEKDLQWMLYRESQLLFMADNGVNGPELWMIHGLGLQPQMMELEPGAAGSTPSNFHLLDETAVFSAWTSDTGLDLWAQPLGAAASVGDWNLY